MIAFLVLIPFVLYALSNSNTIYGGDAGDLLSAMLSGGFAHPPGYPLYVILGRLIQLLPLPSLTPAGKVIILSIFFHTASFAIMYLLLKELFKSRWNPFIASISVLIIAGNYLVWLYSIVPEVFPLNTFITLSIFYAGLRFYHSGKYRYLFLVTFLTGLGITHHHTFVLVLPATLYLIHKKSSVFKIKPKTLIISAVCGILGLLPLLYLPIVSKNLPEIMWGRADTVAGFFEVLFRQGYGTFVPGQFITNIVAHRFLQLKNLMLYVINDFTLAGVIFITVGIYMLFMKRFIKSTPTRALFITLFLYGPFFFFYANFPLRSKFEFATIERFFLIFYFFLVPFLYVGLEQSVEGIRAISRKCIQSSLLRAVVDYGILIILLLYPLGMIYKNSNVIFSLKNNRIAENLAKDIALNAEPNSLILLVSDTALFNTQYLYFSNGMKDNKIPIHASKLATEYYRSVIHKHYPQIVLPIKNGRMTLSDFMQSNRNLFNIYGNEKYPLTDPTLEWVPQGYLFKLVKRDENSVAKTYHTITQFWNTAYNGDLSSKLIANPYIWKNFFTSDVLRLYSTAHQNSAYFLIKNNHLTEGYSHILTAEILNPEDADIHFLYSQYYSLQKKCRLAEESLLKAISIDADDFYYNQLKIVADQCYQDGTNKMRIEDYLKKHTEVKLKDLN